MDESETDDELEQATQEVENKFSSIVSLTRQMYANNNGLLRLRVLKRLAKEKQELRRRLARLGIWTLRPVDIAWNYVIFYNEKIRQLWIDCNLMDPDERRRVMRQISALGKKRRQRLADADQLPDCQVRFWEFHGWAEAEYNEVCRAVEAEIIEKSKLVEKHDPAEQRETLERPAPVIIQPDSTTTGFLDDVGGGSAPMGDYQMSKADSVPMSSTEPSGETSFDTAFENTTSSQEYDADRPGLDSFEKGLFATQTRSKPGEDTIIDNSSLFSDGDDDSLFGDGDDYRLNPAPVSCQTANGAQVPVNASFDFEEDPDYSLFGDSDDFQLYPAPVPNPDVEEAHDLENASQASPINQRACSEETMELNESDSGDPLFGDIDYFQTVPALVVSQAVEKARTPENASHASLITNQGSLVEDSIGTNESGPVPGVLDENHLAEPAAAPGQAAEQPLIHDDNAIAYASVDQQVSQDRQAMELQQMADQSVVANNQAGPPPYVRGEVPTGPYVRFYPDILLQIEESRQEDLEHMREDARGHLSRFWPDGKQDCSVMQLDLFALATDGFKDDEYRRYEMCQEAGKPHVVHFQEEYGEIPPNMTLAPVYNGAFVYRCLAENMPVSEPENEPEFVDLTGDDSTPCTTTAPLDEPEHEHVHAAPAEVIAASEPARPAAGGEVILQGRKTSKKASKTPRKVEMIQTPSPVDQATFTQDPARTLAGPPAPAKPVNNGAVGDSSDWSSDWSGKAFSDGGEPPKTPSDKEVVVMQRSVSDDDTTRRTSPIDKAVGTKMSGRKARTSRGSGSLSSTQSAHVALQNQLSQTSEAAGNVNTPPSTKLSPVEGRQQSDTPGQQQQPRPYYGVSPENRADPKKWVEEHTQGGKGKKARKRKTPESKEAPTPRKARKTEEVTSAPTVTLAPRTYQKIAPAPPRSHDDANNVQMQFRVGSSMDRDGPSYSSSDVQLSSFSTPIHSAMPQVPQVPLQPMHPRIPQQSAQQQQYTQPPVGPQNGWANPMQQRHNSQAVEEPLGVRRARLQKQLHELEQLEKQQEIIARKDREIAELRQQVRRNRTTEPPNMMSSHSVSQGTWPHPQHGNWQQGNVPSNNNESYENYMQFQQFQQWVNQGGPRMMPNQGMAPNGMAPRPEYQHGHHWQATPGQPMPNGYPQYGGDPATMNFNQTIPGADGHGMHIGY